MKKTIISLLLCFFPIQVFAQTVPLQIIGDVFSPDKATIYTAKKIITMENGKPTATAVAVVQDKITAVGSLKEVVNSLKGQSYKIDKRFANKVIMPGLIDPHLHLWLFALAAPMHFITPDDWALPWADIKGITGRDAYLKKLTQTERALKNKKEWLLTWGYHQYFHGQLSRRDLDKISTTRPIVVWHRSCHEMYFNTAALNALKVTEATVKGHGHSSEQTDFANGHFWEAGLELIIKPLYPHLASPQNFYKGLKMCKQYVSASGLTTTADPGIMLPGTALEMMKFVFDNDRTSFRNLLIPSGQALFEKYGAANALAETEKLTAKHDGHRVYYLPKQIKLYCDGAAFSQAMQLKDGYLDGHKGQWIQMPRELEDSARLYWNAGYQVRIHVNGDLGSEVTIGILEKLMKENPRKDHRFSIEHYCVSTPDQAKQLSKLGGIASVNPYYVYVLADKYSKVGLGPKRAQYMVRCNSLIKNNIPLSLHSDTPMAPPSPLTLAWCAVTRLTTSGKVAGPEERITVMDALKAITINAAFVLQKEKEIGSITPGKIADFTILGKDPLSVDPRQLKDIPVWGTIFEGKIYQNKVKGKVAMYFGTDDCVCAANQLMQKTARDIIKD